MSEEMPEEYGRRRKRFFWSFIMMAAAITAVSSIASSLTGSGVANYITGWNNSTDITVVNATYNSTEADFLVTLKNFGSPVCTPANAFCNGTSDGNNFTVACSFTRNGNVVTQSCSRNGGVNYTSTFTDNTTGGGGDNVTFSNGTAGWWGRFTNSTNLAAEGVTCNSGFAINTLSNNSVCQAFATPADLGSYYLASNPSGYISSAPNRNLTGVNVSNGTTHTITIVDTSGNTFNATFDDTDTVGSVSVNASKESSAAVNITPSAITTSGTLLFQFPDATAIQSGFATGAQITSLNLKALAGSCAGWNSTHINVTMNATTAGVQCFPVQFNQSSGSSLSGGVAGMLGVWSSATNIVALALNTSMVNTSNAGGAGMCLAFGTGTQLLWIPCTNLTSGQIATFNTEVNNSGTTETSLYNTTIPGSTLNNDGEVITFDISGYTLGCTATVSCNFELYVNGSKVYESSAVVLSVDQSWNLWGVVQRTSSTKARVSTRLGSSGAMTWNYNNETPTDININWASPVSFNFTGTSSGVGAGSNQIIARHGYLQKGGAANGTSSSANVTSTNGSAGYVPLFTSATNIVSWVLSSQLLNSSGFNAGNLTSGLVLDARISSTFNNQTGTVACSAGTHVTNASLLNTGFYANCTADTTTQAVVNVTGINSSNGTLAHNISIMFSNGSNFTTTIIDYDTNDTTVVAQLVLWNTTTNNELTEAINNFTNIPYNKPTPIDLEFYHCGSTSNFDPLFAAQLSSGTITQATGNATFNGLCNVVHASSTANSGYKVGSGSQSMIMSAGDNFTFYFKQPTGASGMVKHMYGFQNAVTFAEGGSGWDNCIILAEANNVSSGNRMKGECMNNGLKTNTSNNYTYLNDTMYKTQVFMVSATNVTFSVWFALNGSLAWNNSVGTNIPTTRPLGIGIIVTQNVTTATTEVIATWDKLTYQNLNNNGRY